MERCQPFEDSTESVRCQEQKSQCAITLRNTILQVVWRIDRIYGQKYRTVRKLIQFSQKEIMKFSCRVVALKIQLEGTICKIYQWIDLGDGKRGMLAERGIT